MTLSRKAAFSWSVALVLIFHSLVSAQEVEDHFLPFDDQTYDQIKASLLGKPFLITLWSIDCAPCQLDLQLLGEVLAEDPEFPVVIISTDPIEEREDASYMLDDYDLDAFSTYMFADGFVERLMYSIDPLWYGELPRSYFFNADGTYQAHSGVLSRDMLKAVAPEH